MTVFAHNMMPEQEPRPKFYTIKDIVSATGINPKYTDVVRQRVYLAQVRDLTLKPHHIGTDGRTKYFTEDIFFKLVEKVCSSPIKTTGQKIYTARDPNSMSKPQEDREHLIQLTDPDQKRENLRRQRQEKLERLSTERERDKKAQRIKEAMPIHFTNEVLSSILKDKPGNLSRSVHIVLDNARKKVDNGSNIPLAFILGGAPIEDVKRFFIEEFARILQTGFSTNKYPESESQELKELIDNCNKLKILGYDSSGLIIIASRHFDIPRD